LVLGVLRAVLIGVTHLANLIAQGPQLHRRLADRRRKRPRQMLHTPQARRPSPAQAATRSPTAQTPNQPTRTGSQPQQMGLS
jgi:hypothetical protein